MKAVIEPVIQSEVIQEKNKYHVLMHINEI